MRVVRIREHGGLEALRFEEDPLPEPGPGQVRVRIEAVGLNHLDVWVRRGVPGHRFPLPLIGGSDGAGVIETGPRAGERVALAPASSCGACPRCHSGHDNLCRHYRIRGEGQDGTAREAMVVDEADLLPVPEGMDATSAAAVPLAFLTAWQMLRRSRLREGETALILGGTSGVGSAAIQIARNLGAEVVAAAGTPERRARARSLGAHRAVDSRGDYHREVKADVVIEHVGEATWSRSLRALSWGGRLVTCGATTGPRAEVDLRVLFFKQLELIGSTMGTRADLHAMWAEVRAGRLRPVVGQVFAFEDIARAHRSLEAGTVMGKAVLRL
jgi:NADPH:quinone reductase-like Zn-dependent oxidoreductase